MRPQAPWSVHWLQHANHLTAAAPLLLIEHKLKHSGCANKFVPGFSGQTMQIGIRGCSSSGVPKVYSVLVGSQS